MNEVLANTTVKSMVGDLQIVGGGSGHFSLGMMQKQLASVGCQSFGQVPLASLPEHEALLALQTGPTLEAPTITMQSRVDPVPTLAITVPEAASAGPHVENRYMIHNSMTLFATTTDSGSDEALARAGAKLDVVLDDVAFPLVTLHRHPHLARTLCTLPPADIPTCPEGVAWAAMSYAGPRTSPPLRRQWGPGTRSGTEPPARKERRGLPWGA